MTGTATVQQEKLPKQKRDKKSSDKPKTEEAEQLKARLDNLQKDRDALWNQLQETKENLIDQEKSMTEIADELAFDREWLWCQMRSLAMLGKEHMTILMVIEPANSNSSWKAWGLRGEVLEEREISLLLTSTPFKVPGYDHCEFIMRWYRGTDRMHKVVESNDGKRNPYARSKIIEAENMSDIDGDDGIKETMMRLLKKMHLMR